MKIIFKKYLSRKVLKFLPLKKILAEKTGFIFDTAHNNLGHK
jgi:hypothetical protein